MGTRTSRRRSATEGWGGAPRAIRALALLLGLALCGDAAAQTRADPRFDSADLEPAPEGAEEFAPKLRFRLLEEIALPGPLGGQGPQSAGERVRIAVEGGTAVFSWGRDVEVGPVETAETTEQDPGVGLSPDGKLRCVPRPSGWIVAEKRCARCKKGWRRVWKVRAPGSEFARPVVTERRVFYGTTDNRVYSVKRRNGHRVWVAEVAGRVVRPLEAVRVEAPADYAAKSKSSSLWIDLILVVPANGRSMIALDARTGERVAVFDLPEDETLVGAPVSREGKVAVARQKYDAREAALLVFDLEPATAAPPEAPAPSADPADQVSGGSVAAAASGAAPDGPRLRTTTRISPARTSCAFAARISMTSPSSGNPGPS